MKAFEIVDNWIFVRTTKTWNQVVSGTTTFIFLIRTLTATDSEFTPLKNNTALSLSDSSVVDFTNFLMHR